ncbi:MAG TPA: oligosaccharide flippase family protein [Flavihumibacter sp.]|jgi:O-antigen/teichoic acid export membrane protein
MFSKHWIQRLPFLLGGADARSRTINRNILYSVLVKGLSILVNFILVPVTIRFTTASDYGIWLTLSSIITMANFFDLGIGNGLRNKLSEALAVGDISKGKRLIGTAYLFSTGISLAFTILLVACNRHFDWIGFLGIENANHAELKALLNVIIITFCIQFTAQLINTIYFAIQQSAMVAFSFLAGNLLSLILILLLGYLDINGLFWMGFAYVSGNILALLGLTLHLFLVRRRDLAPSFTGIQKSEVKELFSLGGKFFLIQVVAIFQFQIASVLISRYLTSLDVTEYNVAFKLFSVVTMAFGIIITPIWSAATDAVSKNDYEWIRKTIQSLQKTWLKMLGIIILILISSPLIFKIWLGDSVHVNFITSLGIALYMAVYTFSMIYVYMLNGMGVLNVQFYFSLALLLFFFPIAYFFINTLGLGIFGVSMALIVANINGFLAAPIQLKNILHSKIGRAAS